MQSYTCLILTHKDKRGHVLTPHLEFLKNSNPDIDIHIVVGEDHPSGKKYNWRNGDQPLRKWWKENSNKVKTSCVAAIEWDTLVNCKLPDIPDHLDLVAAQYLEEPVHLRGKWKPKQSIDPTWKKDNWWWWEEIPRLELTPDKAAKGLVSLGCYFMRSWVLDLVCKEEWDKLYSKDIISEMRFPTIAHIEGARVGEIHLPFVHHSTMTYTGEKAIYHPIKQLQ